VKSLKQDSIHVNPWVQNIKMQLPIMSNVTYYDLKIASVLWLNMQGIGHAAIVNYCKWPITQQIRPQGAPEGFACFEFFLTHIFHDII
jgi:hypothetical protein